MKEKVRGNLFDSLLRVMKPFIEEKKMTQRARVLDRLRSDKNTNPNTRGVSAYMLAQSPEFQGTDTGEASVRRTIVGLERDGYIIDHVREHNWDTTTYRLAQ